MRLGIGSYTYVWWTGVPGYPQPAHPLTPETLIKVAHASGVSVVQIADNMPLHELSETELARVAGIANERGVTLEAGTRGIQPDHLRAYIRIAKCLGARFVRTLLDAADHKPAHGEAVDLLRTVAPEFERAGVTVGIENHDRLRAKQLKKILDDVHSQAVGLCLDTANSMGCGETVNEVFAELRDYVTNVHIKDFVVNRLPHNKGFIVEGVPAGSGVLNIPALIAETLTLPRDVNIILEQWPPPADCIDDSVLREQRWAEEGISYLKEVLGAAQR